MPSAFPFSLILSSRVEERSNKLLLTEGRAVRYAQKQDNRGSFVNRTIKPCLRTGGCKKPHGDLFGVSGAIPRPPKDAKAGGIGETVA